MLALSGHSPLCAVGHVVYTFSSQESFSDLKTSPHPQSVSGVRELDVTFPTEGDSSLVRLIHKCPQVEELTVKCDSKGEKECMLLEQVAHS